MNRNYMFFVGTALASLIVVFPFFMALSLGLILGFLSEKTVDRLSLFAKVTSSKGRLVISSLFVLSVSFLILLPLLAVTIVSFGDLAKFLSSSDFEHYVATARLTSWRDNTSNWLLQTASDYGITLTVEDISNNLASWVASVSRSLATMLGTQLAATPWFVFEIFLALMVWIVFGASGKSLRSVSIPYILPWESHRKIICETVEKVVRSLFVSGLALALIQAFLVTIVLAVFSVPRFMLLGFLSIFISFIPVFGTGFVMFPVSVYLLAENRPIAALIVAASAIVIGLADNVIRPWLMRDGLPFGFFWTFIAILGGIIQFGFAGMLIGPLVFALLVETKKLLSKNDASVSE